MAVNTNNDMTNTEKYEIIRKEILNILKDYNTNQAIISKISFGHIILNNKKYKLKDVILFYTKFLDQYDPSISERFYYIYHNIKEIITCKYCNGNKPTFQSFEKGYRSFCSNECSIKNRTKNKEKLPTKNKKKPIVNQTIEPFIEIDNVIDKLTTSGNFNNIIEFLNKYDIRFESNKKINSINLDIFIPNNNIGIELNTLSHDTELNGKTKYYFIRKKELFQKKDIEIINIFEDEWVTTPNIVKSMILNKLQLSPKKIFARKCKIDKVDKAKARLFLNTNHVQGAIPSKHNFGLYYNRHLVCLLTLGTSRYNENYEYELHRFCSSVGHNVIGGFSKLLKFVLNYLDVKSLITYADLRFGTGNVYNKNGFEKLTSSQPNYFYVEKNILRRSSRVQFQKHKLSKRLKTFDENKTEWENMKNNKYDRIWDCGNAVYGINRQREKGK